MVRINKRITKIIFVFVCIKILEVIGLALALFLPYKIGRIIHPNPVVGYESYYNYTPTFGSYFTIWLIGIVVAGVIVLLLMLLMTWILQNWEWAKKISYPTQDYELTKRTERIIKERTKRGR